MITPIVNFHVNFYIYNVDLEPEPNCRQDEQGNKKDESSTGELILLIGWENDTGIIYHFVFDVYTARNKQGK